MYNRETTFKSLLEKGADASIHNKNRDTVLYYLAMKGNLYLSTRQLRYPHNVDIRNDNGEILLLCAVPVGNEEAVDQLLQAGADFSLRLLLDLNLRPVDNSSRHNRTAKPKKSWRNLH